MITLSVAQAAQILGLTQIHSEVKLTGISIDSRTLLPGNLFVAIQGKNVDGHLFIEAAEKKGAAAVLLSQNSPTTLPQLKVDDVVLALGKLTANWRKQFNLPVIGVTGSNGKTTLKNMLCSIAIAACQGQSDRVLATLGNFNNQIGLPLTLAKLNAKHQYAIMEMGMNHFGEIDYLAKLTRPNVAVITNAAAAHLEGLGDVAGVARAKAEIFSGLPENGIAVLNRDDAFFPFWHENIKNIALSLWFPSDAEVTATIHEGVTQLQHISLHTPKGDIEVNLPLLR